MQVPLIKLITMIGTAFLRVVELMLSIQVNFLIILIITQILIILLFIIIIMIISHNNVQVCLCVERLVEGGGEVGGVLSTLTSLALEVKHPSS